MADQKLTELNSLTSILADDILYIVHDPNGSPAHYKIPIENLFVNSWETGTTTAGINTNGNTSSNVNSFIGQIEINMPLKIISIDWDIYASGTYSLYLVSGFHHSYIVKTLISGQVVNAPSTANFDLSSSPLYIFFPSTYYFCLEKSGASAKFSYYGSNAWSCELFNCLDGYFDDVNSTYSPPFRITAYKGSLISLV